MTDYIQYNSDLKIAICRACRCGISPLVPWPHFSRNHKETWAANRKSILAALDSMPLSAPDELQHPMEECDPIDGLEVKDGYCCGEDGCTFCKATVKGMELHCREKHGAEALRAKAWFPCRMQSLLGHPYIRYHFYRQCHGLMI